VLNDKTAGRTLLLAVGSLVLLVPLGTSSSAAPPILHEGCVPPAIGPDRYNLWVSACGPTYVVRNTNYTYGVVVKNFGGASFRRIELSVIHYDPITRSSRMAVVHTTGVTLRSGR
jgi:hypothetical protein